MSLRITQEAIPVHAWHENSLALAALTGSGISAADMEAVLRSFNPLPQGMQKIHAYLLKHGEKLQTREQLRAALEIALHTPHEERKIDGKGDDMKIIEEEMGVTRDQAQKLLQDADGKVETVRWARRWMAYAERIGGAQALAGRIDLGALSELGIQRPQGPAKVTNAVLRCVKTILAFRKADQPD